MPLIRTTTVRIYNKVTSLKLILAAQPSEIFGLLDKKFSSRLAGRHDKDSTTSIEEEDEEDDDEDEEDEEEEDDEDEGPPTDGIAVAKVNKHGAVVGMMPGEEDDSDETGETLGDADTDTSSDEVDLDTEKADRRFLEPHPDDIKAKRVKVKKADAVAAAVGVAGVKRRAEPIVLDDDEDEDADDETDAKPRVHQASLGGNDSFYDPSSPPPSALKRTLSVAPGAPKKSRPPARTAALVGSITASAQAKILAGDTVLYQATRPPPPSFKSAASMATASAKPAKIMAALAAQAARSRAATEALAAAAASTVSVAKSTLNALSSFLPPPPPAVATLDDRLSPLVPEAAAAAESADIPAAQAEPEPESEAV